MSEGGQLLTAIAIILALGFIDKRLQDILDELRKRAGDRGKP